MSALLHVLVVVAGIGFLIFIHELGHFLVAKRVGVRVERFSLGFGPAILSFRKGDTEYAISWIPLGGYVKMSGENPGDPASGGADEFTSKPVSQRAAIAVAGIAMNALTALAAFFLAFKTGVLVIAPVVGGTEVGWPAWEAGIRDGDRVTAAGGTPVRSFEDLIEEVALQKGPTIRITVERQAPGGGTVTKEIEVPRLRDESQGIPKIGVKPPLSLKIESLEMSSTLPSPAQAAGLRLGDRVVAVDGRRVASWREVERALAGRAGEPVRLDVERDGSTASLTLTPRTLWTLGLEPRVRITVRGAARDMPAAAAGLRRGDRVLSVDGVPIATAEAFQRSINHGERHPLALVVQREDGTSASLQVEPVDDPDGGRRVLGVHYEPEPDHAVLADDLPLSGRAHAAGLRGGDVLVGVDPGPGGSGLVPVSRWGEVAQALQAARGGAVTLHARRRGEALKASLSASPGDGLEALGLKPALIVGAVRAGSPAEGLGIVPGDRLRYLRLAAPPAGDPALSASASTWSEMTSLVQVAGQLKTSLRMDWVHDDPALPGPVEHHHAEIGVVRDEPLFSAALSSLVSMGAYPGAERIVLRLPGLLAPCLQGCARAEAEVIKIFRTVASFFAPKAQALSPKVLGGPITIFMGASHFLDQGAGAFILFLGVISLNLAVLNLLPVPVLDGGMLLFLAIEKLRGAPIGERTAAAVQYTGLALVLSLVIFVFYNDITIRLIPAISHYF